MAERKPEFEVFQRSHYARRGRRSGEIVTVCASGQLTFSQGAWLKLGSPTAVIFLVGKGTRLVGIKSASADDPDAHRVHGPHHKISAVTLCRYLGVYATQARRYQLADHGGVLCIDLDGPSLPAVTDPAHHPRAQPGRD